MWRCCVISLLLVNGTHTHIKVTGTEIYVHWEYTVIAFVIWLSTLMTKCAYLETQSCIELYTDYSHNSLKAFEGDCAF